MLARDQDEAEDLILEQIKQSGSPDQVYDTMLLPAVGAIKQNRVRGDITEDDERYAIQSIQEIVEDLGQRQLAAARDEAAEGESRPAAERIDYPAIPSSAVRPTMWRIAWPWRCCSRCSIRPDGASRSSPPGR